VIKIFKRSLFPFIYIRGFVWLYKDFWWQDFYKLLGCELCRIYLESKNRLLCCHVVDCCMLRGNTRIYQQFLPSLGFISLSFTILSVLAIWISSFECRLHTSTATKVQF
jgi:hypothetical protein